MFEDPAIRNAYRLGVRDALEEGAIHRSGAQLRALRQWVRDLEEWTGGNPPPAPHNWPTGTG